MKGTRSSDEDTLYDFILEALEQIQTGMDPALYESLGYLKLATMLKENGLRDANTVRNCLLLILALLTPHNEGLDLDGKDLLELSPKEQQKVLAKVKAALL